MRRQGRQCFLESMSSRAWGRFSWEVLAKACRGLRGKGMKQHRKLDDGELDITSREFLLSMWKSAGQNLVLTKDMDPLQSLLHPLQPPNQYSIVPVLLSRDPVNLQSMFSSPQERWSCLLFWISPTQSKDKTESW